jgi:hypothetical protein
LKAFYRATRMNTAICLSIRQPSVLTVPSFDALAFLSTLHCCGNRSMLAPQQQNELIDAGEADLVIGLLANANFEPLIELPVAKRHIVISQFLADAKAWGLSETPDFTGYCCLALSMGPEFATLVPWDQWLPEIKAGHLKFGEALARAESETL